jgi:Crinkler effector protein N-terminal domain
MSSYELWCYIKGTSSPFIVDAERTLSIGRLREVIRDKRSNLLREVDAACLTLWKVRSF